MLHNGSKLISFIAILVALTAALILASPSDVHASADSSPIITEEEAVAHARQLPFLPDRVNVKDISAWIAPSGPTWNLQLSREDGLGYYSIRLSQADGHIMALSLSVKAVAPLEPAIEKEPIGYNEAKALAQHFIGNQDWGIEGQWMWDPYPESAVSTRFDDKSIYKIRFDGSVNGIRFDANRFTVWLSPSGELKSYQMEWNEYEYSDPSGILGEDEAKAIYFDQSKPVLYEQNNNNYPRFVYSLWQRSLDAVSGTFPPERNPHPNIDGAESPYPTVSEDKAKRRLLEIYTVELQYKPTALFHAGLYYQLVPSPDVPLFYTGQPPVLDAFNESWLNFLSLPINEPVPAGRWVEELLASPSRIGYEAAVVLEDQLLHLDPAPLIQNDSTLVPLRSLLEKMGANVQWIPESSKIIASKGERRIELTLNSQSAIVNGQPVELEVPAQLVDEHTFVPARVAVEALGGNVDWEPNSRLVIVRLQPRTSAPTEDQLSQWRLEAQKDWESSALPKLR